MPIEELVVKNFKGIAAEKRFQIRPITVFLGSNSSGKSTVIHSLAALAQTLKLGNTAPALVLDDDFAQVHLGRFVEIAHSKSYGEAIKIGITTGNVELTVPEGPGKAFKSIQSRVTAEFEFKSTMRTQEVYIDTSKIAFGAYSIDIKRGTKGSYGATVTGPGDRVKTPVDRVRNFLFRADALSFNYKAPESLSSFLLIENTQAHVEEVLRQVLYLGPFRQAPLRRYPFRGTTAHEVGAQGEATITLLASEHIQQQARAHMKEINTWLNYLGLATNVDLSRVGSSDLFDIKLTLHDGDKLPIADLGYGLSQVLPVLTQCAHAPNNSTLLFEQPELHLHQGAARKLAKVFVETAIKKKCHVVFETHSRELINEFFQHVRDGNLGVEDLAIYAVSRESKESEYNRLPLQFVDGDLDVGMQWAHLLEK